MPLKSFLETLEKMKEIHNSKSQDYADPNNPLSNFDVSEYGLHLFKLDRDKTFAWPIFTKLARLSTLLNSGNAPNNESIEDSFVDIANYVILWKVDYERRNKDTNNKLYQCKNCGRRFNYMPFIHKLDTGTHLFFCSAICRITLIPNFITS